MRDLPTIIVICVVLVLLIVRNLRPQKMNVSRIWIAPIVLLVLTWLSVADSLEARTSGLLVAGLMLLGAALGAPLGLVRGRATNVRKTKDPQVLVVDPSVLTLLLWVGAYVVRVGLRLALPQSGGLTLAAGDGFLAFAVSSVLASRYVVYTKFKALHAA
ncbi:MAG TPA: hypothetical protein VGD50_06915 [Candidatus Baltobacteraceae bacterium]